MERKMYEPTEKQIALWNTLKPSAMPTDEEFKAMWKKAHHGKETGWGMGKRNWIASHIDDQLTCTVEYNTGLWQGRVDAARGLEALETPEYHTDPFQFGYYTGYHNFEKFWNGYDRNARQKFEEKYLD